MVREIALALIAACATTSAAQSLNSSTTQLYLLVAALQAWPDK
jgi:hypothetical protein